MVNLQNCTPQEFVNSVNTDASAYQQVVTTLTDITNKVIRQKFYQVNIPDFVDVEVGRAAFMQEILHNAIVDVSGPFESGVVNTGAEARMDYSDVAIAPKKFPILNWAKKSVYSIFDVQQAFKAVNFDIIEEMAKARKRNWDLGIQETILTGSRVKSEVTGLINNASVTSNTTLMSKKIVSCSDAEFQALVGGIVEAFFANSNYTTMPNRFFIPTEDYNGLAMAASTSYPLVSRLEYLTNAFKEIVSGYGVADFKILPLAYLNKTQMNSRIGVNKYRYILANKNPDTYYAPIPVDFTMTQYGTLDNFNFYNTAYGQYAGTVVLRPKEILYVDFA